MEKYQMFEELTNQIFNLSDEQETEFYNKLREKGFTEEEIAIIHWPVFVKKMYHYSEMYKAVKGTIAEHLYEAFTNHD